jgi:hypothetical protein
MYDAPYTMEERWSQYYCCNYDYYGNNRYDFGSQDDYYGTLNNVNKMEAAALATGGETVNPYEALGKFFRAYLFTKMSLSMVIFQWIVHCLGCQILHLHTIHKRNFYTGI